MSKLRNTDHSATLLADLTDQTSMDVCMEYQLALGTVFYNLLRLQILPILNHDDTRFFLLMNAGVREKLTLQSNGIIFL